MAEPNNAGFKLEVRPTIRARSPRELLIFNLDDTLIDTSLYWIARAAFARAWTAKTGQPDSGIILPGADKPGSYDVCAMRDSVTMHDVWQAFQEDFDIRQHSDTDLHLMMARSLRSKYPALIPGAEDIVKWAQPRFTLALLTTGDPDVQAAKLEAANLKGLFREIKTVPSKKKEDFLDIMASMGFSPRNSWTLGSSVRADVNPAIEAGANCIYYVHPFTQYASPEESAEQPAGAAFRIRALADARPILARPAAVPT